MTRFFQIKPQVSRLELLEKDICVNYISSRLQREHEVLAGHGSIGCETWKNCYKCHGENLQCHLYRSYNELIRSLGEIKA